MFSELKRKYLVKSIWCAVIAFAIGIVLIFTQRNSLRVMLSPAVDLFELDAEDIKANVKVKADIDFIIDYYAYNEQDGTVIEKAYIIPVGEEEYMGIVLDKKYLEQADQNMEETYAYLDGDYSAVDRIEPFTVKGTIMPLEGEILLYYHEYIDALGWTDEEAEIFLPYALMVGDMGKTDNTTFICIMIAEAVVIIFGLYMLIRGITGGALKKVMKYCESTGNKEAAMQRLEQFYASAPEVGGIRVSQEFFMVRTSFSVLLAETQNVIWIYQHIVKHYRNAIPTGSTYSLMIMKADGSKMEVHMKGKRQAEETLDHIGRTLPYLLYGYDKQLKAAYAQNRASLIQAVADRRAQFLGTQMPEMQSYGEQMIPEDRNQGF